MGERKEWSGSKQTARTEHARAIVSKAEQDAIAQWGNGWRQLTSDQRHAFVCLHVIHLLNEDRVRTAMTVETMNDVIALARLMPVL